MQHDQEVGVHFFEAFDEEAEALRRTLPEGIRAGFTQETVQESGMEHAPSRLISIRTQSIVPDSWLPHLGGILARSTGYDHMQRYVRVARGYLPQYCTRAVAEQALLLLLALLRHLSRQQEQFHSFSRSGLTGGECLGRTLVIVGVGRIGGELARLASALGMRVIGVDIQRHRTDMHYAEISEALSQADVIACCMNLTRENPGYFSKALLSTARRGAIFVNIARGEFVSAVDLLELLESGHLGGVGLDVFCGEPGLAVHLRAGTEVTDPEAIAVAALSKRDDVILTPHNAFNTVEGLERKVLQSVEQVGQFLKHGSFRWRVPLPRDTAST